MIWMDILSPKQLLLFTSLAKRFKELGYNILLTSRRYIQLDELLETSFREWGIIRVGGWGGGSLEGKLRASIERMGLLLDVVAGERPGFGHIAVTVVYDPSSRIFTISAFNEYGDSAYLSEDMKKTKSLVRSIWTGETVILDEDRVVGAI